MRRVVAALTILAGLAAGLAAHACLTDLAVARARLAGRSRLIDSPWGPIEYAEAGHGPAVLMIHGSGGGFDQGLDFAAPLVRDHRVIAPSRFGYLRSGYPANASPEAQADALAELLERLGVRRAVVVGGSAGALSAMQLALRRPDLCRGLVLVVPASYAPDRPRNQSGAGDPLTAAAAQALLRSDALFWAASRLAPRTMTRLVLATDPEVVRAAAPAERRRVARTLAHILPVSARARGLRLDSATAGAPPPYPVGAIASRMLVISVRDDLYGTARSAAWTAAQARDARLVLYDTGGHLWVGHDAALWREVADFIAACPRTDHRPPQRSSHAPPSRPRPRSAAS
jgi:pimeloyl-ACP methyl ester carboxylesterase